MTDTVEDRQRRREIRGSILRTLDVVYGRTPDTATFQSLQRIVRNCTEKELRQELQYLVDLNYVAKVEDKRDALDDSPAVLYRLMAQGKKVLNGDLEDRSIEV